MKRVYSWLLLFTQLGMVGLLAITGNIWSTELGLQLVQVAGILLGVSAVYYMIKNSTFSALPEPDQRAQLLNSGPYQYIRNPMYASILLIFIPAVISDYSPLRLGLLFIEVVVLLLKIRREEKYLEAKFDSFAEYKKRSYRLIPWLY